MENKKINRKNIIISVSVLLLAGIFIFGASAFAADSDPISNKLTVFVLTAFGTVVSAIVYLVGQLLSLLITLLIWVAQYNDFINSKAVISGWTIVRDVANMFFIVILLIIAFATILRQEEYSYKKLLPKLLIMAVLINFSRLICGIFIDIAQVIMLTFVNAFKNMGGANLSSMLGMQDILKLNTTADLGSDGSSINSWSVVGTFILALIYSLIALVVVAVMLFTLVMRMVFLWIYIVLSPLAYLLAAFPSGSGYSGTWWKKFSQNVIVGPVLAFFIWLSFSSIAVGMKGFDVLNVNAPVMSKVGNSVAGTGDTMIVFIIGIGMLIGGLMVTQEIGGAAGSIAGKGMAAIQKGQSLITKKSKDIAATASKATGRTALRAGGSLLALKAQEGSTRGKIGNFAAQWGNDLRSSRLDSKKGARLKTLEKMGLKTGVGEGMEKLKEVMEDDKVKRATNVAKGAAAVGLGIAGGGVPGAALAAAGIAKAFSKKGPIADAMEKHGKGSDITAAEENQERVKKEIDENRKTGMEFFERDRDNKISDTERRRAAELSSLGPVPKNADVANRKAYDDLVKETNKKYDGEVEDHREEFSKRVANDEKTFKPQLDAAAQQVVNARGSQGKVGKFMEDRAKEMNGPNHLTIAATKKGTADNSKAKEVVESIANNTKISFGDFKNTFYSQSGPSSAQNKTFDVLASNKKAVDNIVKNLKDLKSGVMKYGDAEKKGIDNLKKGIAAQIKGGKSVSQDIIDAVNALDTSDGPDKPDMSVDQLKDKVVGR